MISRMTVRKQLANRLATNMSSVVEKVFDYQAGDLKGMSPVLIVTGGGTDRAQNSDNSDIDLEVHAFVLYALPPVISTGVAAAGTDVVLTVEDTSMFEVGMQVQLEDDNHIENVLVTAVVPDVSITLDAVTYTYVQPQVYVWTEEQSEDRIDLIEVTVSEQIRLANDDDTWLEIKRKDKSEPDAVEIAGVPYRHEVIPVVVTVTDF